jgi:uracil-DNA glycosylase family 4
MDADQDVLANPFGMDERCERCPELCETRERVVHGYGDVGADFVFVAETPSATAEDAGVPLVGGVRESGALSGRPESQSDSGLDHGERFQHVLGAVGLNNSLPTSTQPELDDAYVTHLTRCRDPDRPPADDEIERCEPYLNAEIRMINPEVIVPVGQRALREIGVEYTTTPAADLDVRDHHATPIRGRGFELFPMIHPAAQTDDETEEFIEAFLDLKASDYRQTKGRRGR